MISRPGKRCTPRLHEALTGTPSRPGRIYLSSSGHRTRFPFGLGGDQKRQTGVCRERDEPFHLCVESIRPCSGSLRRDNHPSLSLSSLLGRDAASAGRNSKICSAASVPVLHYAITPLPRPTSKLGWMNMGTLPTHSMIPSVHSSRLAECSSAPGGLLLG